MATRFLTNHLRRYSTALNPFEEIPGPPGKGFPILGHSHLLLKKPHKFGKAWENVRALKKQYLREGDKMLRMHSPLFNPPHGNILFIFDPQLYQEMLTHEGKYPCRGPGFDPFIMMRKMRKDIYSETVGVLMEEGEKWHEMRSKVQQDLMRPKSAHFYIDEIQKVSDDFIEFIRQKRTHDNNIDNFLPDLYRYTFESICCISLDTRLGCLQLNMDPEIAKVFKASNDFLASFPEFTSGVPTWKFLPPRWNKTFRTAQGNLDILLDFSKIQVEDAIKRINKKANEESDNDLSLLERMILRNGPESTFPIVMAIDLIFAGIDTTGNSLGLLLYHLAQNPEKQDKLREEFKSIGSNLTVKDLDKMKYFKGCLQESFRLTPTLAINGRVIPEDIELDGYHIPAKTACWHYHQLFGEDPEMFPEPKKFKPERWIENKKDIHPMAVRSFSRGPRMCIGKRFAELELQIATHRIISNFEVKWRGKDNMGVTQVLINVPDHQLDFQFNDV
uniref:Cytochrome P450 3078B1 n=1 Tax=Paracyclopina nana TaxID=565004 RepID=A0A0F7IZY8_PARNA|nr:cytochrome P450 3078B1 [Paracyclopina nana]